MKFLLAKAVFSVVNVLTFIKFNVLLNILKL